MILNELVEGDRMKNGFSLYRYGNGRWFAITFKLDRLFVIFDRDSIRRLRVGLFGRNLTA